MDGRIKRIKQRWKRESGGFLEKEQGVNSDDGAGPRDDLDVYISNTVLEEGHSVSVGYVGEGVLVHSQDKVTAPNRAERA